MKPAVRWANQLLGKLGVNAAVADADVGDAAEDWAASGAMWLTGRSDGPPVQPPGIAASAARGALLAFEEVSALAGRRVRLDGHLLLGERAAAAGLRRQGPRSPGGAFRLLAAADDGRVGLSLARPDDVALVPALVGRDVRGDPWNEIAAWLADHPASAAVERARLLGLPACVVPDEPQPGPVFSLSLPPGPNRQVAPLVVDLSSLWAGPLCAHLLGLAGARIVKVESPDRPDGARRGPAAFYDLLHAGHESLALDLRDRPRLLALLEAADVVIESSRPRALRQLGIDADAIVAGAKHKTWVSIIAYGRTGLAADWVGFGDDTAAAAGLVAVDPDTGTVVPCGDALADPLAGAHAAVAALASVLAGGSRIVAIALRDVAAATLHPASGAAVHPVDPPSIRRPTGVAPSLGADTARILEELT